MCREDICRDEVCRSVFWRIPLKIPIWFTYVSFVYEISPKDLFKLLEYFLE